jgi:citrate lyase subunit beta / citryl-CoA lyase
VIAGVRSWLYVPGNRPELLAKAMAGAADAVVFDLEDAVPAAGKDAARASALSAVDAEWPKPLWVRVNAADSDLGRADLAALAGRDVAGLRLPKAEEPGLVADVAERVGLPLHVTIESALGVERAFLLATAHPLVTLLSLGEADLTADLRVRDRRALDWARQRVVNASRAAGLAGPPHAVWTAVRDLPGLAADTEAARDMGFFGRSVVHPSQAEVVNRVFTPAPEEVEQARALLDSLSAHSDRQVAAWLDENGRFVDPAVAASARWVVDLADSTAADPTAPDPKAPDPTAPDSGTDGSN